jgi:hypothetical protein
MQGKHPSSPDAMKFKTQPSAGKLMLTIFWDSQGHILQTHLERGTAINATCCDMLQSWLKPANHSKRNGRLRGCPVVPRQSPYCGGNVRKLK